MGSLTIYHDGTHWVGLFIRQEGSDLWGALHIFGAEPSNAEILDLLTNHYHRLTFLPLDPEDPLLKGQGRRENYKGALRKARRDQGKIPGGKAREAYNQAQKKRLGERKAAAGRKKEEEEREAFRRRQEKKRRKKRGR